MRGEGFVLLIVCSDKMTAPSVIDWPFLGRKSWAQQLQLHFIITSHHIKFTGVKEWVALFVSFPQIAFTIISKQKSDLHV